MPDAVEGGDAYVAADSVEAWAWGHWHPTALCERFGISRKTGYRWGHRYEGGGVAALMDQS